MTRRIYNTPHYVNPNLLSTNGSERGSALVEFSLILPFVLFLLLGVVDIGLAVQQSMIVSEAAHVSATYATTLSSSMADSNLKATIQNSLQAAPQGVQGWGTPQVQILYACTSPPPAPTQTMPACGSGTPLEWIQIKTTASLPALFNLSTWSQNLGGPAGFTPNGFSEIRIR